MLADLFSIPRTPREWEIYSFAHRISHDVIRAAIEAAGGPNLTQYVLDPITQSDILGFLQRNSQTHIDMNGALGLQSNDLQDVNFNDESQRVGWIFTHYQEHFDAEQKLGVAS